MTDPLAPQYDPRAIEAPLYRWWQERGFYTVDANAPGEPYVIQIPPPNVTGGAAHAGHAPQQHPAGRADPLRADARSQRRSGCPAPTTPASPRRTWSRSSLAKEGLTRLDVGREAFVARVRTLVEESTAA
ncbi:MAG: class I tRNA ligase family protein [Gemmatimonadales bacterium]